MTRGIQSEPRLGVAYIPSFRAITPYLSPSVSAGAE
jgi:hypothetical protein